MRGRGSEEECEVPSKFWKCLRVARAEALMHVHEAFLGEQSVSVLRGGVVAAGGEVARPD